jgi:hypothetical protein
VSKAPGGIPPEHSGGRTRLSVSITQTGARGSGRGRTKRVAWTLAALVVVAGVSVGGSYLAFRKSSPGTRKLTVIVAQNCDRAISVSDPSGAYLTGKKWGGTACKDTSQGTWTGTVPDEPRYMIRLTSSQHNSSPDIGTYTVSRYNLEHNHWTVDLSQSPR